MFSVTGIPCIRTNEWTPRSSCPCSFDWFNCGRVFPWPRRTRCALVYWQYFPIHTSRFWSICSVGSYSISCRIPTNIGHWHGYHAGENYYNKERIYYISTGTIVPPPIRPEFRHWEIKILLNCPSQRVHPFYKTTFSLQNWWYCDRWNYCTEKVILL